MNNRDPNYGTTGPPPPLQTPIPRRPLPNVGGLGGIQGQSFGFPPPVGFPSQNAYPPVVPTTFRCTFCNKEQLHTQNPRLPCFHKICFTCLRVPPNDQTFHSCPICSNTNPMQPRKILGNSASSELVDQPGGDSLILSLTNQNFRPTGSLAGDTSFSIWGPPDEERSLQTPQQNRPPYSKTPGPPKLPFSSSGTQLSNYSVGNSFSPSPLPYLYGHQQHQSHQPQLPPGLGQLEHELPWMSLNDLTRQPTHQPHQFCASCVDDDVPAHAFCQECNENLCSDCVTAHFRVRMTRDHHIQPINRQQDVQNSIFGSGAQAFVIETSEISGSHSQSTSKSDSESPKSSSGGSIGRNSCGQHDAPYVSSCTTCGGISLCVKCIYDHSQHQVKPINGDPMQTLKGLVNESKAIQNNIDEALDGVRRMIERVDISVQSVTSELRSVIHLHISALEERKRDLLQRVETIRNTKMSNLKQQNDKLSEKRKAITEAVNRADMIANSSPKNGNGDDLNRKIQECYESLLHVHSTPPVNLQPNDTDVIRFVLNDQSLVNKIRTLGDVISGVCAKTSHLMGFSYKRAILGRKCNIHVQLKDACGEVVTMQGPIPLQAHIFGPLPNRRQLETFLTYEKDNGIITVSYTPVKEGSYVLDVVLGGISISGCPVEISVRSGRDYREAMVKGPRFSFGKEGSGDGEFSRPWGICCDHKGRIIVADRSNNRIQIFNREGMFLSKFGTSGTGPGEFDRPAGVCVNTHNQIVVADKDNHRIQVFTEEGYFLLKFGERGRAAGSFYYPWGVTSNANNDIAVSDTRNHRIQIFNERGQFLRKCGFDSTFLYKHLDSPRGVCFMPDGDLLVTDFNNHRLAIINTTKNPPELRCIGSEGEQPGLFHRPQGVILDPEGHILVCDSRNNRIQVLNIDDVTVVAILGNPHIPEPNDRIGPSHFSGHFNVPPPPPSQPPPTGADSPIPPAPIPSQPYTISSAQETPPKKTSRQQQAPPAPRPIQAPILDRPTDVCVSPEGLVYVVDFGHNCVRVY